MFCWAIGLVGCVITESSFMEKKTEEYMFSGGRCNNNARKEFESENEMCNVNLFSVCT